MTKLTNETRELNSNELDIVVGGSTFLDVLNFFLNDTGLNGQRQAFREADRTDALMHG